MNKKFIRSTSGSTAIEYTLIAGLIAVAMVAGATNVGSGNSKMYAETTEEASALQN